MSPRRTQEDELPEGNILAEEELDEEDLDAVEYEIGEPVPDGDGDGTASQGRGTTADGAGGPHGRVGDGGGGRTARFALGAGLMLAAIVLVAVALPGTYYSIDYRFGPDPKIDPTDEDVSDTTFFEFRLADVETYERDVDGNQGPRDTVTYDDVPIVGILMGKIELTTYVGLGLVAAAFLAAVLHRFGALNVPGPAPVLATFGIVLLFAGLIPFILDIAHHARIELVPGRLDLQPAFFTRGADGTQVHDVNMGPGLSFWLHTLGVVMTPFAAALLFWSAFADFGRALGRVADEAVVD